MRLKNEEFNKPVINLWNITITKSKSEFSWDFKCVQPLNLLELLNLLDHISVIDSDTLFLNNLLHL